MTRPSTPARSTRVGPRPAPRVRPLAELLPAAPAQTQPGPAPPAPEPVDPGQDALDRVGQAMRPRAVGLLTAVVDVVEGRRPVGHLEALAEPAVLTRLAGEVRRAPRSPRTTEQARPGQAVRAGGVLRGLRVCAVTPDAVEVAAVITRGERPAAVAGRLERRGAGPGTWRLTALVLG